MNINSPGHPGNWINGLKIEIFSHPLKPLLAPPWYDPTLLQTIDSLPSGHVNGEFWTVEIPGNSAHLVISSNNNFVSVRELGSFLFMTKVAIVRDPSISSNYIPPSTHPLSNLHSDEIYEAYNLTPLKASNREATGIFGGLSPSPHYYYAFLNPNITYAIYVSPLNLSIGNDIGIVLGNSTNGFILPPTGTASSAGKVMRKHGDTGIYYEIGPYSSAKTIYLTVRSSIGGSYFITVNEVAEKFEAVYEMSTGLQDKDAPNLDRSKYAGTVNYINPYGFQIGNFVGTEFNPYKYTRRLKEVIVLASAHMLAASEGYLRFGHADIYVSEHWWLNTDIFTHQINGRAYTSWSKINIFLNELNEPLRGARTLHHEWGHHEYGLGDEYLDVNPDGSFIPVDNNSVMGHGGSYNGIPAFEFCTSKNHKWTSGTDDDANWPVLESKYQIGWGSGYSYPSEQGQYLDVLHALDSYIDFDYYE
jgi:hypothetical protein